jgi:ABC-type dipeptide/oligopeptide/nickel transport system permease subunit
VAVVAVAAVALAGGLVAPEDPVAVVALPFSAPSGTHVLGTDALGRDVLSRALAGGTGLVLLAAAAGVAASGVGILAGLAAGWWRGHTDRVVSATAGVLLALPVMLVALVLAVVLPGQVAVVIATVCAGAPLTAQVVRDASRRMRGLAWAEAAQCRGESATAMLVRELIPAMAGLVAAELGLRFVLGLQLACTITLLGFGAQPPSPDWALMLRENLPGAADNPAAVTAPALLLAAGACALVWSVQSVKSRHDRRLVVTRE